MEWQPIETAPKDGTVIVAYGKPAPSSITRPWVTYWRNYGEGSIAHLKWKNGEGPQGAFMHDEPMSNWQNGWQPTHWMPLPPPPSA